VSNYETLQNGEWECKYRVINISKCRRQVLYGEPSGL
jgi:hypothetical protein